MLNINQCFPLSCLSFMQVLSILFKFVLRIYNLIINMFITIVNYCKLLKKIVIELGKERPSPKTSTLFGKRTITSAEEEG